jgi:hypothetical protein
MSGSPSPWRLNAMLPVSTDKDLRNRQNILEMSLKSGIVRHKVWDLMLKIQIQIRWTCWKRQKRLLATYPVPSGFCKSSLLEGDSIQTGKKKKKKVNMGHISCNKLHRSLAIHEIRTETYPWISHFIHIPFNFTSISNKIVHSLIKHSLRIRCWEDCLNPENIKLHQITSVKNVQTSIFHHTIQNQQFHYYEDTRKQTQLYSTHFILNYNS